MTVLRFFPWLLRITGSVALLAVFAVVMPFDSMDATHRALGMGPLPDAPIVNYLARSVSAFYTLFGGLLWVLSFDVLRYRTILTYLGCVMMIFGSALLAVDWGAGMPAFWVAIEGPFNAGLGAVILFTSRRLGRAAANS